MTNFPEKWVAGETWIRIPNTSWYWNEEYNLRTPKKFDMVSFANYAVQANLKVAKSNITLMHHGSLRLSGKVHDVWLKDLMKLVEVLLANHMTSFKWYTEEALKKVNPFPPLPKLTLADLNARLRKKQ